MSERIHKTEEIYFLAIFAWFKKDPEPDPNLVLMDLAKKTYGSGSATLQETI